MVMPARRVALARWRRRSIRGYDGRRIHRTPLRPSMVVFERVRCARESRTPSALVPETKMSLRARICSRAFGRTSGQARIMTFLSLAVFRLVHLGSRAAEAHDDWGLSRSRRIAHALGFATEPQWEFICRAATN
jgi:hypothetical protein